VCVFVCVVRPQKGLASNICLLFSMVVPPLRSPFYGLSMLAFCRNVNTLHILFRAPTRDWWALPAACHMLQWIAWVSTSRGVGVEARWGERGAGVTMVVGGTLLSHLDSGANKLWRQEVCTNTSDYKERRRGEGVRRKGVALYELRGLHFWCLNWLIAMPMLSDMQLGEPNIQFFLQSDSYGEANK